MLGKTLSSVLIVESENGDVYFVEDKSKKIKIPSKRCKEAIINRVEENRKREKADIK